MEVNKLLEAIKKALVHADGEDSFERIVKDLSEGLLQGWQVDDFFMVTRIMVYDNCKKVRICYAAGSLDDEATVKKALALVEDFAKNLGCQGVEIVGRKGWVRRLAAYGYHELYTVTGKRFEESL